MEHPEPLPAHHAAAAIAASMLFAALVGWLARQSFSPPWSLASALERTLCLVFIATLPWLARLRRGALRRLAFDRVLVGALLLALGVHLLYFAHELRQPPPINDVPIKTVAAAEVLRHHQNPYTSYTDVELRPRVVRMRGYNYSPLTILYYAPWVWAGGRPALSWANLVLMLLLCALLLRRHGHASPLGALVAACLLVNPQMAHELYLRQVIDLVATIPFVFAIYWYDKPLWSAALCAAALSAKLFPAGLAVPFVPRRRWLGRQLLIGLPILLVIHYQFVHNHAAEFIERVLLCQLERNSNETSLLYHLNLSQWVQVGILALAAVALLVWQRRRPPDEATLQALMLGTLFLATNKVVFGNYLIWIFPLLWLAVGRELWRAPAPGDA